MDTKEVPFWIGAIVGLIVGTTVARALGLGVLLQILAAVGSAGGLGYLADRLYKAVTKRN